MSKFMDLLLENDSEAKIREIITAMENDGDVYKQLNYYFNTIYKKQKKGQFDKALAIKGLDRIIQDYTKVYTKKYGAIKLSPSERKEVATKIIDVDYSNFLDDNGLTESASSNSPENRVLEFCVRTDYKTKQYDIEISDSSSLDDVLTMIHFMIRDIDRKQASVPFDNNYLVENYKRWCKGIVDRYNMLQYKRDDNEEKPKNFSKVTLTKKFIVDFCNLIWEKRDYLKKIKK